MSILLDKQLWFPDPRRALTVGSLSGFVAVGGDLSQERLLLAYRSGIFPWSFDPVTWWSPDPRGILPLDQFHVSRSLRRRLRPGVFEVSFDTAFRRVMEGAAARTSTWISAPFVDAYDQLHRSGHAHSVEVWQGGELVGGVYGVHIGGFFAGESMFHRVSDASKVALFHLVQRLRQQGFHLFDVQMVSAHTRSLGAVEIARSEYLERLQRAVLIRCEF